ncbi:N-acetylneuraminate synthase family protein [Aerococcus kribbianus]|uniref:N-acetylneuraminate synthase family protein n=1 Tax=Aerococcus kribbianus TaxID=2999064 RepID=A0A9X3FUR7_9LACT|nr:MULTISPECIES: N-acetylneuraminate synthase family protein [unclassified Aerococcus]MCZ0717296.1 N-acetylneuraminate synthase family protein [Aerococcus sp. YH-aer221]MCZ0725584.1 N-acetylneuraminate synthase family protein [Aerococcus sp. YH-aer222]
MTLFETIKKQGYYVIGEIGVNYYDIAQQRNITPMQAAKLMIDQAIDSGMDAVKFQTYKAETIASKFSPSYWDTSEESTTSQYELFKKFDSFAYEEYKELSHYCKDKGIDFFSTAFDFESADYLEDLMPVYKISSSDLTNLPFIAHQASKQKPVLLSTGASTLEEIHQAVETIEKTGNKQIILLHCVLEYPTPYEHANLNVIRSLKEEFPNYIIGYSDHTKPDTNMDVIKTAVAMGAPVIEKHYTLDKSLPGNDHYHAMDPEDMKVLKQGLDFQMQISGSTEIDIESQSAARQNARRSIVLTQAVKAGHQLRREDLTFKRPGTGLSPEHVEEVIGKIIKEDLDEDTILQADMLS